MNRRNMMLLSGMGALGVGMLAAPGAQARPDRPQAPAAPLPAEPAGAAPGLLFSDEFDGPAGSRPDAGMWNIATARERIKNPVFWDRPENMGEYTDDREHVFLDGNSNLVIRATRGDDGYVSGKVFGNYRGGMGTTWEARVKLNCLTDGAWPAFWLSNNTNPRIGGEIDLVEWYGNRDWPSGTTVHARPDGTSFATHPHPIDSGWHVWRVTWNDRGLYFWEDYAPGMKPYFEVPAFSIPDWPFNDPGYTMFPVFNLAVGGSGGGDPAGGSYPAEMLVDWIRVF